MPSEFPAVEPHGPLEPIIENAWYVTGSVLFKPLLRLPRNMVVLRHNGELTLINCVRLDDAGEKALNDLGKVSHVLKIGFHSMDDAYYLHRYGAKYWVVDPKDVPSGGEELGVLEENAELPIPNARVFMFRDTVKPEAAILVEREGGLLITCDSVQHWVPKPVMSLLARVTSRLIGFQKPAQIGPLWRKKQSPPGKTLRSDFERLAALSFQRLIGGHGGLLERNGPELLRETISREFTEA